jgi:hypothetical protein
VGSANAVRRKKDKPKSQVIAEQILKVYNINRGRNPEILQRSRSLVNLIEEGLPYNTIAKTTGLPPEKIAKLAQH